MLEKVQIMIGMVFFTLNVIIGGGLYLLYVLFSYAILFYGASLIIVIFLHIVFDVPASPWINYIAWFFMGSYFLAYWYDEFIKQMKKKYFADMKAFDIKTGYKYSTFESLTSTEPHGLLFDEDEHIRRYYERMKELDDIELKEKIIQEKAEIEKDLLNQKQDENSQQ